VWRSVEKSRYAVLLLLCTLLCTLWIIVLGTIWGERKRTLEANERYMQQLTSAVEEQSLGLLRLVETSLEAANMWIAQHPKDDPATAEGFRLLAEAYRKRSAGLVDIRLVHPDGRLRYIGVPTAKGALSDVSDRDYFKVQRDPATRGFYIGKAMVSRVTGKWGIPLSLPVQPSNPHAAVLSCLIDMERLNAMHEAQRIKPGGSISLLRQDGVFLSRVPFHEELIQNTLYGTTQYQQHLLPHRREVSLWKDTLDGKTRFVSHAWVGQYPLVVAVTVTEAEVLAPWRKLVTGLILLALTTSILAAYLGRKLFLALADNIAANVALERQASTDGLTGLLNRQAFMQTLLREVERARRTSRPLSVLMIDIDHFKKINDTHGHATGDVVLRKLGRLFAETLRSIDFAGRMGGEEFCVLLPDTALPQGVEVAERLRRGFEESPVVVAGREMVNTLSAGVAQLCAEDVDVLELLHRTDKALYHAKETGRNRVEVATPPEG